MDSNFGVQAPTEAESPQSPAGIIAGGASAARPRRGVALAGILRRSAVAWSLLLLIGVVLAAAVALHGVTRAREASVTGPCYAEYRGDPPATSSTGQAEAAVYINISTPVPGLHRRYCYSYS